MYGDHKSLTPIATAEIPSPTASKLTVVLRILKYYSLVDWTFLSSMLLT
jgi:hypothetical protein